MGGLNMYRDFGNRMSGRIIDFICTPNFFFNNEWILILWILLNRDRCDSRCFGITYDGHYSYYDPCIKDKKYCCNDGLYFIPQCGSKPCTPCYNNSFLFGGDALGGFWWILILLLFRNRSNNSKQNQESAS